jgi:ribosomal protein S18 acetylase RimI-like enzyme
MNIFPTNIQYFLLKHFENNKEIIKLYTNPKYKNKKLRGYYYPKKLNKKMMKTKMKNQLIIDAVMAIWKI